MKPQFINEGHGERCKKDTLYFSISFQSISQTFTFEMYEEGSGEQHPSWEH